MNTTAESALPQDLDDSITAHARWVESEGREGKRINFRGVDLSGLHFSERNLAEASFRGAALSGTVFTGCDLRGSDFAEANLSQAQFTDCRLSGAILSAANMQGCRMENVECASADFANTHLAHAALSRVNGFGATLRDAHLTSVFMTGCSFTEANFRGAKAEYMQASTSDFTHADFRGANLAAALFEACRLDHAEFRDANLASVNLSKSDFTVALEVGQEYFIRYVMAERAALEQEKESLQQDQEKYMAKRAIFDSEKTQVETLQAHHAYAAATAKGAGIWFMSSLVVWSLFSLIILGLFALTLSGVQGAQLQTEEMILLFALVILPAALFAGSVIKSAQAYKALRRTTDELKDEE